jgi:isocitrate/isopropylmalate dehydrogenase
MLHHLGETDVAARIQRAVTEVLVDGPVITADLKRPGDTKRVVGTQAVTDAIIAKL